MDLFALMAKLCTGVVLLLSISAYASGESIRPVGRQFELCGSATGNRIVFYYNGGRACDSAKYFEIFPEMGDGPESIAKLVNAGVPDDLQLYMRTTASLVDCKDVAPLLIPFGNWSLSGVNTGFNIPVAPTSLTLGGSWEGMDTHLHWECPLEGLRVRLATTNENCLVSGDVDWTSGEGQLNFSKWLGARINSALRDKALDSLATAKTYYDLPHDGEFLILVQCEQDGILSGFSVIRVSQARQNETYNIPFTGGIAPNWSLWSDGNTSDLRCTEGRRGDVLKAMTLRPQPSTPGEKVFFQQVQVATPGAVGGVQRKFIGLRPERAYRLSARMNTMSAGENNNDWSYSLHTTYAKRDGLTAEQLAGDAPLPNGQVGAAAGRMADYSADKTTDGQWIRSDTGPDQAQPDIVLPEGYDTIVVWVRFTSQDPEDVVGIDWVQLEDLGPVTGQEPATEQQ